MQNERVGVLYHVQTPRRTAFHTGNAVACRQSRSSDSTHATGSTNVLLDDATNGCAISDRICRAM